MPIPRPDGPLSQLLSQLPVTWDAIDALSAAAVTSVFGRTGAVVAAANDYTWAQINKATSSLADITTRSASDLSSGTLPDARFPATLPALSGVNLTALNASNLASGTVPDARLSANVTLGGNSFTGTGAIVKQTSPSLITPSLGDATASSLTVAGDLFINSATANLFMKDVSTGWRVSATTVITPQNNNAIRSTNYTSGLVGWNISAVGNAEFNNVDIRGAIHASIFTYNTIAATAGTLGVFKASGKLRTLTSTPVSPSYGVSTINVEIEDIEGLSHAASQIFAVNDILRLKDPLAGDVWLRVLSVSDQITFWRYVSTVMAGTANAVFNPGLGVPNYGPANTGFIIQTADQTNAPYMQMATHPATFTSQDANGTLNVTPRLRIGNLNGSYGFATDIYGFGTGQYGVASQNWLTVDDTNGIRIGNNTTVNGQWSTDGEIVVGPVGVNLNNIRLSATVGFQLRTNTTAMIAMGFAGDIRVGQVAVGQANILIISGQLDIRNNATSRIRLAADGSGFLANSSISWDTSGNLTVVGNATIAGWSISATKISSTGIDINSGASAGLAFGTTPPTSASVGTGIWLDRTGLYGLASNTVQVKVDATSGKLIAGASIVGIGASGVEIAASTTKTSRDYRFVDALGGDYLGGMHCLFSAGTPAELSMVFEANADNDNTGVLITCNGGTSKIELKTSTTAGGARDTIVINGGIVMGGAGGAKGVGTINLSGDIYKNNSAYANPDFVLEHWATGKIEKFAHKEGASSYKGLRPLSDVREFIRKNYHLPGFGQNAEHGIFSGSDQLLLSVEQAYLYIFELEQEIRQLKGKQ